MPRSSPRAAALAWVAASTLLLPGCGDVSAGSRPGADEPQPSSCPPGQAVGPDGVCMPVGIQGCAPMFLENDGLCHPAIDKCPAGTVPKLAEGCVAAGIPACAPEFLGDDGLCHPTMTKCPEGTFAVPGEGCLSIDGPGGCGHGVWGELPTDERTLYVDKAFAGGDGDGSAAKPFATIAAATARARDGARIVIAAGDYDEPLVITRSIEVAGRCASMVRIRGATTAFGPAHVAHVGGVRGAAIRGVEIMASAGVGLVVLDAELAVERVRIRGARDFGLLAGQPGTRLSISHSWIDGTRDREMIGGAALTVQDGATVTADACAFTRNAVSGALATRGGSLRLANSLVEGTIPGSDGQNGMGVLAVVGAQATVDRCAIVGNSTAGVDVAGQGSAVSVTASLIERTLSAPGDANPAIGGPGARASFEGTLSVDSSALVHNEGQGVLSDRGDTVTLTGNLLRENVPLEGKPGAGVLVLRTHAALIGNAIVGHQQYGVSAVESDVEATGNLIEGSVGGTVEGAEDGKGLTQSYGRLTLSSNAFVRNSGTGVDLRHGVELTAAENLIEGTLPLPSRTFGRGAQLLDSGVATISSTLFDGNRELALYVISRERSPAVVDVSGCIVANTLAAEASGEYGVGIVVDQAALDLRGSILRENRTAALMANHSVVRVAASLVDGVPEGAFTTLRGEHTEGVGDGILALPRSTVDVTGSAVRGCARAGLLYSSSAGTIADTRVDHNAFGVVLQGAPQPTLGEGLSIEGNVEQDLLSDGDFIVADTPAPLP